jgi:hypothetical protein
VRCVRRAKRNEPAVVRESLVHWFLRARRAGGKGESQRGQRRKKQKVGNVAQVRLFRRIRIPPRDCAVGVKTGVDSGRAGDSPARSQDECITTLQGPCQHRGRVWPEVGSGHERCGTVGHDAQITGSLPQTGRMPKSLIQRDLPWLMYRLKGMTSSSIDDRNCQVPVSSRRKAMSGKASGTSAPVAKQGCLITGVITGGARTLLYRLLY